MYSNSIQNRNVQKDIMRTVDPSCHAHCWQSSVLVGMGGFQIFYPWRRLQLTPTSQRELLAAK